MGAVSVYLVVAMEKKEQIRIRTIDGFGKPRNEGARLELGPQSSRIWLALAQASYNKIAARTFGLKDYPSAAFVSRQEATSKHHPTANWELSTLYHHLTQKLDWDSS